MQEKKQNNSPIKQRILQFIEELGVSKREFYSQTSISRGTLESGTGITEDIIARFIATYQNISPVWLLTGEGAMFNSNEPLLKEPTSSDLPGGPCQQCRLRDIIIAKQEDSIELLKDKISQLSRQMKDKPDDIRQKG